MKEVNAEKYAGKPPTDGESQSHYLQCDDGFIYLVKFVNSQQGKRPINELVGGTLATDLDLPSPETVLVNISQGLISGSPELISAKVSAGIHLGIKKLDNAWDFWYFDDAELFKMKLVNDRDLYGTVDFDNWVINNDRDNRGNNMIQKISTKKKRFVMIDYGRCFADPNWNTNLENWENQLETVATLTFIKQRTRNIIDFNQWFDKIEKYDDKKIEAILDIIPPEWKLLPEERKIMLKFIKNRKHLVRKMYDNNIQGDGY